MSRTWVLDVSIYCRRDWVWLELELGVCDLALLLSNFLFEGLTYINSQRDHEKIYCLSQVTLYGFAA